MSSRRPAAMARTSRRARRTSTFFLPGAFDLFGPSKALVLKNIWIFAPLYSVPLIFYIHSWIWSPLPNQHVGWWHNAAGFSSGWPGSPWPSYFTFFAVGLSLLWFIIITAVGTAAQVMAQMAQLEAAEEMNLHYQRLWNAVKELGWRMFGLYLVMSVLILLGLVVFVIPGLFLIRRFFLSPYVMLDKKLGIRESLDESARLSGMNTGSIWGVIGVMFLIGFVNIVPVIGGLASFILGSLYSVAPALRYEQLKKLA